MAQVSKITPTGTLYTAGTLDEVTYNPNSGVKKNLLNYSQGSFTNGSIWTQGGYTITDNTSAILAPDGTQTATLVNITAGANALGQVITPIPGATYTFSFYALRGTATNLVYSVFDVTNVQNISAGVSYYSQTNATTWSRISLTFTVPLSCKQVRVYPIRDNGVTGTFYLWGAQLELSPQATIYVPTGANAVPLPTFAARTDSNGNNYIANIYDEVTYNPASGVQKNLLKSSNFTSNWNTGGASTLTPNNTIAPDGTTTAALVSFTNTVGSQYVYQNMTWTKGNYYTLSVYAKPILGNLLAVESFQQYGYVIFSLSGAGSVSSTYQSSVTIVNSSITYDPTYGYYRCSVTFLATSTGSNNIGFANNSTQFVGNAYYLWGAQAEINSALTIYEPTNSSGIPVPTFAQRTEVGGNVYVRGNYDEVSQPLNPVTDASLIMHLDPAMTNSYPGTGTRWYDLSPYGNHATFVTGAYPTSTQRAPGYSTDYGGIIVLNGGQQNVPNAAGNNVWANTSIKTSTFTTTNDRTLSIWVRMHKTTNGLAWMNPVTYGVTGTTSSYTYGTGYAPSAPLVSNPVISQTPANYVKAYGTQGIFLGCSYFGDYGLYWYTSIFNSQNSLQIGSENRINTPSYIDISSTYTYNSNPPTINPFYGTWHNIVSTYSYTGNAHVLYIDGVAVNTQTTSATAVGNYPYAFAALMIGYAGESGGNSVYGYLDADVGQCLIYNRALTLAEVQQNFTTYCTRYGI